MDAGRFILATAHRAENVDNQARFTGLIKGLQMVQAEFGLPLIYPVHHSAKKQAEAFGLDTRGISLVAPLDYLGFFVA